MNHHLGQTDLIAVKPGVTAHAWIYGTAVGRPDRVVLAGCTDSELEGEAVYPLYLSLTRAQIVAILALLPETPA